jgi:hypothetical protein
MRAASNIVGNMAGILGEGDFEHPFNTIEDKRRS